MIALWVKVRVKPEGRERFLKAIEVDALGSEKDEPGCYRFNVLQDQEDQNVYYFYEVYRDEAALEAHRAAPHYAVWRAAADSLDGPTEPTRCTPVFPADRKYWPNVPSARRRYRAAPFSPAGNVVLDGLPAGDYVVVVSTSADFQNWQDPAHLEALSRKGQRVTLVDGDKRTMEVRR